MAHMTQTPALYRPIFAGLTHLFEALATRYTQNRLYNRTLNELARLSDRELADLGLSRSSLRDVAYQSTYDV